MCRKPYGNGYFLWRKGNRSSNWPDAFGMCFNDKRIYLNVPVFKKIYNLNKINKNNNKIGLFAGSLNSANRDCTVILNLFKEICIENNIYLYFIGNCDNIEIFKEYEKITNGKILKNTLKIVDF